MKILFTMRAADAGHIKRVIQQAMSHLHQLSVARFSGPDSGAFLQAQLSADISTLEIGDSLPACYCSPRGQVIGLLRIWRLEDEYLAAAAASLLPGILQRLQMYVLRSQVRFSIAPELNVYGLPEFEYRVSETDPGNAMDPQQWKEQELRRGICWLEPQTSEKFIPQMLGFDRIGAVSFSKGCYPGQEIVARARYLGRVKRGPLLLQVEQNLAAEPGDRVRLDRGGEWSEGTVVDLAPSADQGDSVVFIVAPVEPSVRPERLEFGDQVYRCATI